VSLQQGSVLWVTVADQAGRNPKSRPAIVVTPTSEIKSGDKIVVVAATSTFSRPLPGNRIELPWSPGGHASTGLYKRCVAVCDWVIEIEQSSIISIGGTIPKTTLDAIIAAMPEDPATHC
jgi:mRNA-degrading endonuclease toxin of MazEF toxin-antitoxin module